MSERIRRVAVTGASGYVGTRLVQRLQDARQVGLVLAADIRPPPIPLGSKAVFLRQDISTPLGHAFSVYQIDTVVHLAYVLRPGRDREAIRRVNVGGTANVLEACADAKANRIIYLSSTSVYGAHPDNPPMLTEEVPPRPVKGFQYGEDKAEAESLVREFSNSRPDVTTTILRCCPVMGPNADNFIARAFLRPVLVAVRSCDPPMQLIHEDDLTDVLARCTLGDTSGLYNVAGEGLIHWSEMVRMLRRRLLTLPAPLLYGAIDATWKLRLQSGSPSSGLDFIRYRWTASTDKIMRELGIESRYSSRQAWEAFVQRRR